MKRRGPILFAIAVVAVIAFVLVYVQRRTPNVTARQSGLNESASESASGSASGSPLGSLASAMPMVDAAPFLDRAKREELRRRILQAWAEGEKGEEAAKDAKQGRFEEHPNANGEGIDPKYIQAAVREQMFPMVRACYEELLSRKRDAGTVNGKVEMWFKIVGDEKLGGIVEEDEEHDGGMLDSQIADERFETCTRESLMTLTFPPPAHGGVVTVGYPIVFSANDDEADGGQ